MVSGRGVKSYARELQQMLQHERSLAAVDRDDLAEVFSTYEDGPDPFMAKRVRALRASKADPGYEVSERQYRRRAG